MCKAELKILTTEIPDRDKGKLIVLEIIGAHIQLLVIDLTYDIGNFFVANCDAKGMWCTHHHITFANVELRTVNDEVFWQFYA